MKFRIALTFLLSFCTFGFAGHEWPEVIPVTVDGIHIPIGYDDNDMIKIVTTGTLKKSCYWEGNPEVKVNNNARTVTIKQIVLGYPSTCTDSNIPFHRVVEIGMLPASEYAIIDGLTKERIGTLPVTKATKTISYGAYADEAMYALATDVFVNNRVVTMDFLIPEDCLRFKEAQVDYQPGVVVVKPILEGDAACKGTLKPYRSEFTLRGDVKGRQLIHVRSLWGRSLNKLIELGD